MRHQHGPRWMRYDALRCACYIRYGRNTESNFQAIVRERVCVREALFCSTTFLLCREVRVSAQLIAHCSRFTRIHQSPQVNKRSLFPRARVADRNPPPRKETKKKARRGGRALMTPLQPARTYGLVKSVLDGGRKIYIRCCLAATGGRGGEMSGAAWAARHSCVRDHHQVESRTNPNCEP